MWTTLVSTLDQSRRLFWRGVLKLGLGNRWIRDRSARLTMLASVQILFAFVCTLFFPLWLLLLGPLILGVPHIISDIRYLLIRPPEEVSRGAVFGILAALTAMTGLRIYAMATYHWLPQWEMMCGCVAVFAGLLFVRKPNIWQLPLVGLMVFGTYTAFVYPRSAILWLGHIHNFVAFGLWLYWSKGEGPWSRYIGVLVLYLGCIAMIGFGVWESFAASMGAFHSPQSGLDFGELVKLLAPGMDPTFGFRLVLIYAFAQAIHYVVWLRLVPGNQHFYPKPRPTTFKENFERLRMDFGTLGLYLCILGTVAIPIMALFHATGTRNMYLSLVLFHGWLEFSVIANLLVKGRKPKPH